MIYIIFFVVCFGASAVGAICGIGGGVIIKPVLDSLGILNVTTISFLSGCTVLSMTTYSVVKSKISGEENISRKTGFPLAMGAAAGGVAGKCLFSCVKSLSSEADTVGAVQALCLLVVTFGTLLYTVYKDRIRTYQVENAVICMLIGIFLGIMSSFLGIGGGPINLVVLFFFFSMPMKVAAENSLYIIFFSQLASLIATIVTGSIPQFQNSVLFLMIVGGVAGVICGRAINKRIKENTVNRLFIALMVVMIVINIYNLCQFL